MREILYRAKRANNGDWVIGSLFVDDKKEKHEICIGYVNYRISWEVIPETVGEYTGLTDKNGVQIFEGDIIKSCEYDDVYSVLYFANEGYPAFDCNPYVEWADCNGLSYMVNTEGCEVIGNIHDNPELMKKEV